MIMFNSIVSSIIAVSVLTMPVAAEARGRGEHRAERSHRGLNTGEAIALGVGAFILGAAIKSDKNREREVEREVYDREYDYHYRGRDARYRPDRNCYDTVVTSYDRWGRRWERVETRCF
jgi:hypothetical protein